jgi:hypothetical protein
MNNHIWPTQEFKKLGRVICLQLFLGSLNSLTPIRVRAGTKNCRRFRQIDDDVDCHADAAVQRGADRPMEHIQGFTRSHWMPPSGECSHRIATTAAMVDDFGRKHKTLTKNYF